MKRVRWILLAVLITVVAAGASAFVAYGQGKEAGITEGVAMRSSFLQQRSGATNGAAGVAAAAQSGTNQGQSAGGATGQFARGQGAAAGQGQGTAAAGVPSASSGQAPSASSGQTPSAGSSGSGAAGGQGTRAAGGQGSGAGGNFTAGQVKSVNGNEIEVTTQTESVVVKLTAQTQIQKTVAGAASDIQPGERIVVQGSKGADGAVEARSVQLGQLGSLFSGAAVPIGQGNTP